MQSHLGECCLLKPKAISNYSAKCIVLFVVMIVCSMALPAADLRQTLNFNRGWKFQLGDVVNADAAAFADSNWDDANLPHSFSMPYFAANDKFYVGYGWYRKHLTRRRRGQAGA